MKILIDIGHPAHVHYFRNLIKIMQNKGHEFLIISRDKEVSEDLLKLYGIKFISRGKGSSSFIGKFIYLFRANLFLYKQAVKFEPDIFLSFSSPYAAQVSKILHRPHIAFDDTEHALLGQISYLPFTDSVCTPYCYEKHLGSNQIKFNSFMELSYLHDRYYKPNPKTLEEYGLNINEKFVLIRFVSWHASHDFGYSGLNNYEKVKLVNTLNNNDMVSKVLISSEGEMPTELEKYRLLISPDKIHDIQYYASLFIGEGATMVSECSMLGTPSIYINPLETGYLKEQVRYGMVKKTFDLDTILKHAMKIVGTDKNKMIFSRYKKDLLSSKIDLTAFMVWFLENYPNSQYIMKRNPYYQKIFKIHDF